MTILGAKTVMQRYVLILIVCSLVGLPLVWSVPRDLGEPFVGTDSQAVALITTLAPDYQPWVKSLWTPPGPEVESFLFALQAALGAGVVGYYLGRRERRRRYCDVQNHRGVSQGTIFPSDEGHTDVPG